MKISPLILFWILFGNPVHSIELPYPHICDRQWIGGETVAVARSGNTLYAGTREGQILLFSLENPASPSLMGSFRADGRIEDLTVRDNRVFVSLGKGGLAVYNQDGTERLAGLASPAILGLAPGSNASLFLASGFEGAFEVGWNGMTFEVPEPLHLSQETTWRVRESGSWIGLVSGEREVALLHRDSGQKIRIETEGVPEDVLTIGDLVVVSSAEGLFFHDRNALDAPLWIERDFKGGLLGRSGPWLLHAGKALSILRLLPGGGTEFTGNVFLPHGAYSLAVHGHMAYLACGRQGLLTVDFRKTKSPRLVRRDSYGGEYLRVTRAETLAYGVLATGDLDVFDLTRPDSPARLARYSYRKVHDAVASGTSAILAGPQFGLFELDFTNPANPRTLWELNQIRENASLLARKEDLLFVSTLPKGLRVVRTETGGPPRSLFHSTGSGTPHGIHVHGDRLLVSEHRRGFQVWDISNPSSPRILASTSEVRGANRFASWENRLLLADRAGGLKTYDLRADGTPVLLSECPGYDVTDLTLDGDLIWMADGHGGILAASLSGNVPKIIGRYGFGEIVSSVLVEPPFVYGFTRTGRLLTFDTEPGPIWIAGDLDGDLSIGYRDIFLMTLEWDRSAPAANLAADLDGDGRIGPGDLQYLIHLLEDRDNRSQNLSGKANQR